MPDDRDRQALALFEQALDLPQAERHTFVHSKSRDAAIANKVLELLEAHAQADSLLAVDDSEHTEVSCDTTDMSHLRLRSGRRLADRYEVERVIGAGGMGEVYCAIDHRLGRRVALKVLPSDLVHQTEMLQRFEREARSVATLTHPNIVVLHDILTDDDVTVVIAEYIEGKTLRALINQGLSFDEVLPIARELAAGLAAAHRKQLMHRDIKPENIMVADDGQVKILDFGLARHASPERSQAITQGSSTSPGTVPYMSPEQVEGKDLTVATDIFSLGTVLYEMLSGANPFRHDVAFRTMQSIVAAEPPDLKSAGAEVPLELQELLQSMFALDVSQRPTADQVGSRLESIGGSSGVESSRIVTPSSELDVPTSDSSSGRPTIAVLPLRVLSSQEEHHFFGEAVAQEIIVEVSRLRWLPVIARGSSFHFRDAQVDVEEAFRVLGARYLLSGTLMIHGDSVSVSLELCYAPEQRTVWAERFSGGLDDLLQFRFVVTNEIVGALETRIQLAEAERVARLPTDNLDAWSAYHRGLAHMYRFNAKDNAIAAELFRKATQEDPHFSRAFAGLSFTDFQSVFLHDDGPEATEHLANARRNAERSAELDPLDPFSNLTLARASWLEGDLDGANSWLDEAIRLNPSFAFARYNRGLIHVMCGVAEPAEADAKKALQLSPIDPLAYAMRCTYAMSLMIRGRFEEALPLAEEAIRQPTAHIHIFAIAAVANEFAGHPERAAELATMVKKENPSYSHRRFFASFPFRDIELRSRMETTMAKLGL